MLLFSGGLTKDQTEILLSGKEILFDRVPYERAGCNNNNTFDYVPIEYKDMSISNFKKYVSLDCYKNQYIFLAKYLYASLGFCINSQLKNYILVCDIDKEKIEQYIGVGDYKDEDYRIEYRVPRKIIDVSNIVEFLYFEPWDHEQMKELYEKYKENFYIPKTEYEDACNLIKQKKLVFNRDKFK